MATELNIKRYTKNLDCRFAHSYDAFPSLPCYHVGDYVFLLSPPRYMGNDLLDNTMSPSSHGLLYLSLMADLAQKGVPQRISDFAWYDKYEAWGYHLDIRTSWLWLEGWLRPSFAKIEISDNSLMALL